MVAGRSPRVDCSSPVIRSHEYILPMSYTATLSHSTEQQYRLTPGAELSILSFGQHSAQRRRGARNRSAERSRCDRLSSSPLMRHPPRADFSDRADGKIYFYTAAILALRGSMTQRGAIPQFSGLAEDNGDVVAAQRLGERCADAPSASLT
jgi:hypothetical protein